MSAGAALGFAGCGGAAPPAPLRQAVRARVVVKFPAHRSSRDRKPRYVSPATTKVVFTLTSVDAGAVPSGFTASQTVALTYHSGSTQCSYSSSAQSYTCTTSWTVPAASDAFTVQAYDASSRLLSTNALTQTVAPGNSTIAVTLWGVPASVTIASDDVRVLGSSAAGLRFPIAGTAYAMKATATDADGDTIVGPGAPPFSAGSGAAFTVSTPGSDGSFTVTPLAASTYKSATLSVSADFPSGGPTPFPTSCPAAACSASATIWGGAPIVVANGGAVMVYPPQQIVTALAGGVRVAQGGSLTTSVGTPGNEELGFDASRNLFTCDTTHSYVWVYTAASVASAQSASNVLETGSLSVPDPSGLAFDSSGDLFVTDQTADTIYAFSASKVASALAGAHGVTSSGTLTGGGQRLIFDASGNLWSGVSNVIDVFTPSAVAKALAGTTTGASGSLAFTGLPESFVFDKSGNLFASNDGGGGEIVEAYGTAALASAISGKVAVAATGSIVASTSGSNTDLAFDPSGDLLVTQYNTNAATAFCPTSGCTYAVPAASVTKALTSAVSAAWGTLYAATPEPHRVLFDAAGDAFVSDAQGGLDAFSASQVASAVAGTAEVRATGTFASGGWELAFAP